MKGHTQIILTNVETGEQEIREDDNLITNALDKIINFHMAMNIAPNSYGLLPIATQALGGIMLFDDTLTEDPDNIHFPTEAHLVGYATVDTNTDDTYRGSWNSVESGKLENGYKSVWDFGTSQANGVIKSVARTSRYSGGCPLYLYRSEGSWTTSNGTPENDRTSWYPIRYDGEYVYMIKFNTSTHIARLARVKIPMLKFGVADYSDVARTYEVIASWSTYLTDYTYYSSQSDKDNNRNPYTQYVYAEDIRLYEDGHDGFIYCCGFSPDRSYYTYPYDITYFTIKYSDGSWEKSDTVRLSTGLPFWTDGSFYSFWFGYRYCGHIHNGVLYRLRYNRKIIDIIPLNNPSSYNPCRVIADDNPDYIEDLNYGSPYNGGVWIEVYHYTSTSWNRINGIVYPDGIYCLPDRSYQGQYNNHSNDSKYAYYGICINDDLSVWGRYDDSDQRLTRLWESNYLGTINNLSSPITKTAAQTMKIIYTLTDVDEDD